MSTFAPALIATIVGRLIPLFLTAAGGNDQAAAEAARATLLSYQPETETELTVAAEIISFSLHALDALARATDPNLSINQIIRLRGSAVSLSRESHKARRKLDQLQKTRRQQQAEPEPALDPTPEIKTPATAKPALHHPVNGTSQPTGTLTHPPLTASDAQREQTTHAAWRLASTSTVSRSRHPGEYPGE